MVRSLARVHTLCEQIAASGRATTPLLLVLIRQRGLTLTVLHGRMIRVTGPGVLITADGLGPLSEADLTPIRSDSDALRMRRRSS